MPQHDPQPKLTQHGVFLSLYGRGVLLTGEAGIGKSACAYGLIEKGYPLIADDAPYFCQINHALIMGYCPARLAGILHHRQLGFIDVRQQFGAWAYCPSHPLDLVIHFENNDKADLLQPIRRSAHALWQTITQLSVPYPPTADKVLILVRQFCGEPSQAVQRLLSSHCEKA